MSVLGGRTGEPGSDIVAIERAVTREIIVGPAAADTRHQIALTEQVVNVRHVAGCITGEVASGLASLAVDQVSFAPGGASPICSERPDQEIGHPVGVDIARARDGTTGTAKAGNPLEGGSRQRASHVGQVQ